MYARSSSPPESYTVIFGQFVLAREHLTAVAARLTSQALARPPSSAGVSPCSSRDAGPFWALHPLPWTKEALPARSHGRPRRSGRVAGWASWPLPRRNVRPSEARARLRTRTTVCPAWHFLSYPVTTKYKVASVSFPSMPRPAQNFLRPLLFATSSFFIPFSPSLSACSLRLSGEKRKRQKE